MPDWPEQLTTPSSDDLSLTLSILQRANAPMTAIEIAAMLHLDGCRESQRRRVRAIIEELRNRGVKVVANQTAGCWIAKNEEQWRDYLEGRMIEAKHQIGEAYNRKQCTYEDGTIAMFGQCVSVGVG